MKNRLSTNQETWNKAAPKFLTASALPIWGPFEVGKSDKSLIGQIKDKVFLEIGCGNGRSIRYLIKRGARKVYGLDISSEQLEYAKKKNAKAIKSGEVELFLSPMEKRIKVEQVDTVYSIYALGWALDPRKTLRNIYSYLKPGGRFVWSWDHSIFSDITYKDENFIVCYSYHNESILSLKNWKESGTAHLSYRKTSTWFKLLADAGFRITQYLEPAPASNLVMQNKSDNPERYYSLQKARMIPCTMIWVCEKPKLKDK